MEKKSSRYIYKQVYAEVEKRSLNFIEGKDYPVDEKNGKSINK